MSDSPASRPIADLPPWVRFVTFIVLFMIGTSRESVLPAFGYVDMGWPRWIFAGVMAVAVMAYIVLFNGDAFPRRQVIGAHRLRRRVPGCGLRCLLGDLL